MTISSSPIPSTPVGNYFITANNNGVRQKQQLQHPRHSPSSPAMDAIDSVENILDSIEGNAFEEAMKERNRIRKEREEYTIAELKVQMVRLEDALAAETKRRIDATTKVEDEARQQIYELETRLKQQLEEDNTKLQARVDEVQERLLVLEERWSLDASKQMETIHQKSMEFTKTLDSLQQEQDTERKARLRREGSLLEQVEHHAKEFEDRWNVERQDRLEKIAELERRLTTREEQREREQAAFQRRVEEELELLRSELDLEVQERQTQDEQIVGALNRYTQQLQQSLSILSSD